MAFRVPPNQDRYKQAHQRMLRVLWWNPDILAKAVGVEKVWCRSMEHIIDPNTQERVDLLFQDKYSASRPEKGTTCFVVELKSELGDHEIVGQLKKAVRRMEKAGKSTKHWDKTVGIAIAKKYTQSGMQLLWDEGFRVFQWSEVGDGIQLKEIHRPPVKRRAMSKEERRKFKDESGS